MRIFFGEIEDSGKRGSAAQGALACALNDGAIGDGIAEGYAEFDHVGARFGGCEDDFFAGFERRVACGNVGDDSEFAGFGEFCETPCAILPLAWRATWLERILKWREIQT